MKNIFISVLLFFVFSGGVFAESNQTVSNPGTQITVNTNDLPPDVLAKLQAKQEITEVKSKLETAGEYAKFGHEIGIAVNETLVALTEQADKFSGTKVGQWAMILVTWKVMATDAIGLADKLIGYIIGPSIFFFGSWVTIWSYRKHCVPRQALVREDKDGAKTYDTYFPHDDVEEWAWAHVAVLFVIIVLGTWVMFS